MPLAPRAPQVLRLAPLAACVAMASPAFAWVDTDVEADSVVVDVGRDGTATVAHELLVKIRGGPLAVLAVEGVDADADPVAGATVVQAQSGATKDPSPVAIEIDDGALKIGFEGKGLRSGAYLVSLAYRTDLRARRMIQPAGALTHVRWVGPRFRGGLDSARVLFRLPAAKVPPEVTRAGPSIEVGLGQASEPVFLSSVRQAADKDEIDLVRPHIAKGESVVWRVTADAAAFDGAAKSRVAAPPPVIQPPNGGSRRDLGFLGALAALALAYGLLVAAKTRAVAGACGLLGVEPRPIVPLPSVARAALSGAALAVAAWLAMVVSWPTLGSAALLLAMALAGFAPPDAPSVLRPPGRWEERGAECLRATRRKVDRFGRWLDAGALTGFCLFAAAFVGIGAAARFASLRSHYDAVVLAMGSAALLPVFFTGRRSELPAEPATHAPPFLRDIFARARRDSALRVSVLTRMPIGGDELDDLRLLVLPRAPIDGLRGIEVGVEHRQGAGGPLPLPYVLLRVLDDSAAHRALRVRAAWTRGRSFDERVAILRPILPSPSFCAALVRDLIAELSAERRPGPAGRHASSSSRIASGSGASASKRSMRSSPAHAT